MNRSFKLAIVLGILIFCILSTNAFAEYRNHRNIDIETLNRICNFHKGYPYVWGGSTFRRHKGFDCSGFIYSVFRLYDKPIPRTTSRRYFYSFKGDTFDWLESSVGDLVWFTFSNSRPYGHIGIITEPKIGKSIVWFWQSGASSGPKRSKLWKTGYWDRHKAICKVGLK